MAETEPTEPFVEPEVEVLEGPSARSGYSVVKDGILISTGYATESDAQLFVDCHLGGDGEIHEPE